MIIQRVKYRYVVDFLYYIHTPRYISSDESGIESVARKTGEDIM
jgi:hypothetical protein